MRRLKIVHITWNAGIGGLEQLVIDIANEQTHDAEVWIIVINGRPSESVSDRLNPAVKLVSLGRQRSSRVPWAFLRLNWIVQRIRPDIIHAHHWNHRKLLLSPPGKSVLTVHATRESDVFDNSTRRYQRVFAVSKAVADDIQVHRKDLQPIVVRNGVNCSELRCQPRVPSDVFRIVEIARLDHDIKGQDILLRAVARIHKQPGGGAVRLDLIGEGASRPYLENLARELGIDVVVNFRGVVPRSRMYDELCEYDLLVQASRYEGFGLAIVEGMAAGIPVLVSDLEGPREIVANGQFGFLFRPEDDADCAKQIEHIREMRRAKRLAGLLVAAKAHAMEQFDVKQTAREYLRNYRELLGHSDHPAETAPSYPRARRERPDTYTRFVDSMMRGNGRNALCGLLALSLMAFGRVRQAKKRALGGGVVTPIYFHNPNKRHFARCIGWLMKHGYTFISIDDLLEIISGSMLPPRGAVWISLDDGFKECLENVLPLVRKHNIPVTLFIPSGIVEGEGLFPWLPMPSSITDASSGTALDGIRHAFTVAEIKQLASYPEVTIGSHTVNHAMTTCLSEGEIRFELAESKRQLEAWVGTSVKSFAFPVGRFDGREKALLAELGYVLAATSENAFITPGMDSLLVPRFSVADNIWFPEAICNLVGVWRGVIDPLIHVRNRGRRVKDLFSEVLPAKLTAR